jgi:hypothetical protein
MVRGHRREGSRNILGLVRTRINFKLFFLIETIQDNRVPISIVRVRSGPQEVCHPR